MPKETVRGCLAPYLDDDPSEAVVEVRWGRDNEYVQVVSRCVNRATGEVFHGEEDAWRRAVDLSLTMHNPPKPDGEIEGWEPIDPYRIESAERDWLLTYLVGQFGPGLTARDGFFVDVDRRGINSLIRHLRRARDQAYGRDE